MRVIIENEIVWRKPAGVHLNVRVSPLRLSVRTHLSLNVTQETSRSTGSEHAQAPTEP